jgi:hypothetical protein
MGFRSKVSIAALLAGSLIGVAPEALADPTDEALVCLPRQVTAKCPSIKTANVADALADNLMDSFHRSRAAIGRGNARVRVVFHAASAVANSEPTWLGLEVVERLHTKIQNRLRAELGRRQTPQQIKALKRANWSANDIRDFREKHAGSPEGRTGKGRSVAH